MEEIPVKVALRIRPLLSKEILHNHQVCVRVVPNTQQIIIGKDRNFTFDYVFGKASSQDDVYGACIKPLLVSLIEGYNATVFAYGQTGSGKTYTIGGGHVASVADEEKGIIPRAIQELFQIISENHNTDFNVTVSYIEVYKEDLRDLLELETNVKDIHIREDEKGNTVIVGAKESQVECADEVISLLEAGSAARHTSATQMNEHSSRSHTIFTITICQQSDKNHNATDDSTARSVQMITSKFHFVDLAGSERATKTGNTGERFKESIQINSGLLALGNVISALADPKRKNAHVPYRDAKITRILKDSLGGNAKTVMITCISPSTSDFDESLNSLKYANRARNIKNKPIVNYNPDWDRIDEMELEIKALREALQNRQSTRVSRISQVSQDWGQEKDKVRALEEQLAQFQLECYNHRHCTEEALSLFYEFKDVSGLTKSQTHRLESWLVMAEELRSDTASVPGTEDAVTSGREEPHHITILQLKRELKKCQDALATDEEVFARQTLELKELQEKVEALQKETQDYEKSLEETEHSKNLQTEKLVEQQILIDELRNKVELLQKVSSQDSAREQEVISKRPYSVPLSHQFEMMETSYRQSAHLSEPRKVRTSPPSYSLERVAAGFRTRSQMLSDLREEQDEVCHENFPDHSAKGEAKAERNATKSPFRRSINRTWTQRYAPEIGELNNGAVQTSSNNEELETIVESVRESQSLHLKKLKTSELRLADAKQKMRELTINIKLKEELINELIKTSNGAQSVNKQYSMKIAQLAQDAEQAKTELADAQKQLQELENKELRDQVQKAKLQKDFRKKMEAAKLKMQVLQKKQQDTKKLVSLSVQNEKCVSDLEKNIQSMQQQQSQLQKKLKEENEKKRKLELAVQKDQQQIKELQLKTEQQQKMLKLKNEEIASIRRQKSASSIPDQLQLKMEEQKKWLDEEVEKVLKERHALSDLEEDLKKREESVAKMEAMHKEKSHLEIKKLRSSQALNSDVLRVSTRLSALENELKDKSKNLNSGNIEEQRRISDEVKGLQKERDHLLQRRDSLDEKLKNGTVLSPGEEHILFQLEEGIDALEAAIEYKNESIQSQQQALKDSSRNLTQSENSIIEKFSSLSAAETRSIIVRYFQKVVSLRETEWKLKLQCQELTMKVSEQENIVRELESTLEHHALQTDRRITQQQKDHEQKMQLILQHFKDTDSGVPAENTKAYEAKIEKLEKDLFFYKSTSRELKKKLRDLVGESNVTTSKNNGSGDPHQNKDEPPLVSTKEQKWASKIENNKANRKSKDTVNNRILQNTSRLGDFGGAGDQASDPYRQIRRHFSSGDEPEDFLEPQSLKSQVQPLTPLTKAEINRSPLVVNPVKLSRREVRQISLSDLSTRRSSVGSIVADSIELAQKSTDFKV
ncbi:PREDICTED: kinesin-like protein KIF27 [Nanorana parkeri]|uniref:kinesin-like protein KIF27 n=1 Tax=Nanorana parkeri TaxID=125878 RepID=UPI00085492FC|nr:PREDICTED: kinesin-like protein KIF27 [Nanorana parkeri]